MSEQVLKKVTSFKCQHNQFLVDPEMAYVECALCHEHLNPMWCMVQLCNTEARAIKRLDWLNNESAKAEKKNRCKCEKCGQMTRIQK